VAQKVVEFLKLDIFGTVQHIPILLLLLHPFNGLFSWTTWVSWYQKGKTSLDYKKAKR